MYGLEVLESMNDREMRRYHKEQRRKKDAIKNAILNGLNEYDRKHKKIDFCSAFMYIEKEIDKLDLENQENL